MYAVGWTAPSVEEYRDSRNANGRIGPSLPRNHSRLLRSFGASIWEWLYGDGAYVVFCAAQCSEADPAVSKIISPLGSQACEDPSPLRVSELLYFHVPEP